MQYDVMASTVSVIIPTCNAGESFEVLLTAFKNQTKRPDKIIVIDSESTDCTKEVCLKFPNIQFIPIKRKDFRHGRTRDVALQMTESEFVLFVSQDVILEDTQYIEKLLIPFADEKVAMTSGRQLARPDATEIERLTREFNYPAMSNVRTKNDIPKYGIKTFFASDVCSAYRRTSYDAVGGFDKETMISEDMLIAARFIYAGFKVAYAADACVVHSHNFTLRDQFKRNSMIAQVIEENPKLFGNINVQSEGKRMVKAILKNLLSNGRIGAAMYYILESASKYAGNRWGKWSCKRHVK